MKKLTAKQKEVLENKTKQQLEGVNEANKIYNEILVQGYGNLTDLQIKEYKEIIKGLKSYYIKEIYNMFEGLFKTIQKDDDKTNQILLELYLILNKSKEYLENKIENVEEVEDRALEVFIQINDTFNSLKKEGYTKEANIILLTTTKDLKTLKKTNEIWLDMDTLDLYHSQDLLNIISSEQRIQEDVIPYLYIKEMGLYPGSNTPKIVFKDYEIKETSAQQIDNIINGAHTDLEKFEQEMKDYLKHTLNKYGYYLIQANKIYDMEEYYILENPKGQTIKVLKNSNYDEEKAKYVGDEDLGNSAVLIEVIKDDKLNLIISMKALITKGQVIKVN